MSKGRRHNPPKATVSTPDCTFPETRRARRALGKALTKEVSPTGVTSVKIAMKTINIAMVPESATTSPKGKFSRANKDISVALGRKPESSDLQERHPFDVQICRIPPGKSRCPYHSHTAQFEFFHVLAGSGSVRDKNGLTKVGVGDAFLFPPGEPHQLINDGTQDFVLCIVADNPLGDACHYPDSDKWLIEGRTEHIVSGKPLTYFDGEE